ncbi:Alpha-L-rhamnosidase N-terminal domain-containing protein [Pedobacter westerhofensis]|uniref:Alpha-L-rhamnosidase N-terminal domain-containing protein n=1 Tax=Pedobacter westerhofensis TaxID=425512 RepID=A0A521FRW2_9SPHI|nr:alpha-L-rhamnosidase N-terminal domain-containing protein [Pedobacter westerhofensis]SMO98869.1 Alpha-L-rhamnosidase N-terminal domain-containing protein [Pedobacter westerhofensis]
MKLKFNVFMLCMILGMCVAKGQTTPVNPKLLKSSWPAYWVTSPNAMQREYGVYHFRRTFNLSAAPANFIVHVSADNRYRLFVNGKPVCSGPARGDLFNWYYESIDISSYLKRGSNTIAALVWNMGELAAVGQISNQTAFMLQGNGDPEKIVNTGKDWKVSMSKAFSPCSKDNMKRLQAYMVVGPGDQVDGKKYAWGWENLSYDDSKWDNALEITHPEPVGYGTDNQWTVTPRSIPLFEEQLTRFAFLRRSSGMEANSDFLLGKSALKIPAQQTVSILIDNSVNISGYPEILTAHGTGATIRLTYAESLFDAKGVKGNRNDIDQKEIKGNYDIYLPDGGDDRKFRPLWIRSFRYLQLDITTKDEPLEIRDIYCMKTGYPLEMNASFSSSDPTLREIWNVGWRTAQLCAGEQYYDTPYYEQLQYTGDSRIQALISLYISGDVRLMRKAILDFYHSRTPEGLTQGRYPSNRLQIIPTFSLFWISMIHDYWMYRHDDAFVKQFLPAINEITEWYSVRIDKDKKMLGPLTWWNFIDWDNFNDWGTAPGADNGNSSIITLQYAYTLNQAADLFKSFGHVSQSDEMKLLAAELNQNTFMACFNAEKGLIADTPDQQTYSQHAGIWAVLSGAVPQNEVPRIMQKLLQDKSIGQVTFFYRFYLTQALRKAELADVYYSELTPWRDMLKLGLSTFAEKPEPTRSDCHAWSASPNYDFLATICGITSDAPGFERVLIRPFLGELTQAECTMPHPSGQIAVKLQRTGESGVRAEIKLPEGLTGTFAWKNKTSKLHSGTQTIVY